MIQRWFSTALIAIVLMLSFCASAEEHFFDSDGLKLRYWDEGEGEPILLVHGYTATGSLNWRINGIQQLLSKNFRVIMPDVRGHGKSEMPKDDKFGVASMMDQVRLLDHLGIDSAHVVGYSMGGMITIKMMTMYPERVRSAVVAGMGWIEAGSEDALSFLNRPPTDARLDACVRGFGEFGTSAEEMKAVGLPVKVIIGTEDPGQVRRVSDWKEFVPDLDVLYIEGATHQGCVFREELKEGISTFVTSHAKTVQASN